MSRIDDLRKAARECREWRGLMEESACELETLRAERDSHIKDLEAENYILRRNLASGEAITRELQARLVRLEGEDMRRDRKHDELLHVATALRAGYFAGPIDERFGPMSNGDTVESAKRLIAAVDAACEQPAGEAKAYTELTKFDDGYWAGHEKGAMIRIHDERVHHGHLVPAKGE